MNLVVCDSMKHNRLADNIFCMLQKLYAFIERSPARHHTYIECLEQHCADSAGKQLLQMLSNTRWSARADNLEVIVNCYPAIVAALTLLKKDPEANGLLYSVHPANISIYLWSHCIARSAEIPQVCIRISANIGLGYWCCC